MAAWRRFGVALFYTVGLAIGGIIYRQVGVNVLFPMVDPDGTFSTPVIWLENIVPLVLLIILLAVWAWVIAGAVQDERTVDRRRRVR
jgi:protein-S-isoprenylcysteine O-methyltransferase Ste14